MPSLDLEMARAQRTVHSVARLPSPGADRDRRRRARSRLLRAIVAEYRDMPGLSPTTAQAVRLWGGDCLAVLIELAEARVLVETPEGRYVRADVGIAAMKRDPPAPTPCRGRRARERDTSRG